MLVFLICLYLTFGLDSFLQVHASVPIPVIETRIRLRLVEHISGYYVFSFCITRHSYDNNKVIYDVRKHHLKTDKVKAII